MAKILIVMRPEKGHLNSSLKIAKTLKARGHTAIYLQLFEFEDYVRKEGVEFAPLFGEFFPKGYEVHRDYSVSLFAQLSRYFDRLTAGQRRNTLDILKDEMNKAVDTVQPDLVLMDSYLAIPLMPAMPAHKPPCMFLNSTVVDPYTETAFAYVSRMTTLFLCPQEFDLPHQQRLPQYRYVEASCDVDRKETAGFPWDRIDEKKKLVYCALGSQSHWSHEGADLAEKLRNIQTFLQAVISALSGQTDYQLVMATGLHLRAEDFHSVPPDAVLVNETPQLAILKKAHIAITHGGLNSVKECIFFGVPMIVFPVTREQSANAARVAFHKIGVAGNLKTASAESIGSSIAKLESDPAFKDRANAMMEVFQKAEREQGAANLIEECLSGKLAVPPVVERESQRLRSAIKLQSFARPRPATAGDQLAQAELLPGEKVLSKETGA